MMLGLGRLPVAGRLMGAIETCQDSGCPGTLITEMTCAK